MTYPPQQGQPGSAIALTAKFLPLAFFFDFVKPVIEINGYRVELGEVEAIINRHPDVSEAACVVRDHGAAGSAITAFVVLRPGADPGVPALRRHCAPTVGVWLGSE